MAALKVYSYVSTTGKGGMYRPLRKYDSNAINDERKHADISDTVISDEELEKLRKAIVRATQDAWR